MTAGIAPRRSSSVCNLMVALVERNGAHSNKLRHRHLLSLLRQAIVFLNALRVHSTRLAGQRYLNVLFLTRRYQSNCEVRAGSLNLALIVARLRLLSASQNWNRPVS